MILLLLLPPPPLPLPLKSTDLSYTFAKKMHWHFTELWSQTDFDVKLDLTIMSSAVFTDIERLFLVRAATTENAPWRPNMEEILSWIKPHVFTFLIIRKLANMPSSSVIFYRLFGIVLLNKSIWSIYVHVLDNFAVLRTQQISFSSRPHVENSTTQTSATGLAINHAHGLPRAASSLRLGCGLTDSICLLLILVS